MKRTLVLTTLLATSLLAKVELSLNLGTNSFAGSENLESATSLGIRGDFYIDSLYHLDFGFDDLGKVKIDNLQNKIKIQRIYTQFSADGEEEYHVVPTMSIGIGYEKQKGDYSDSQPYILAGINFRYNVSNNFNFLLGTKAIWKTDSKNTNFHTTFGVGYLLGEEPINNQEEIQNIQEIKISEKKYNISNQFSQQDVNELSTPPTDITIENDPKISTVINSQQNSILPPPSISMPQEIPMQIQNNVSNMTNRYFIQVAAYSKNQPTSLLTRLANSGKHIILRHQGNITKALVGPYSSESQARMALNQVKRIARGAFIYKGN